MTAHHAVLVMQVTDVERHNDEIPQIDNYDELPDIVQSLADLLGPTDPEMVTETYWRATHYMSESSAQYASGKLTLAQKALAEQSYFAICRRLYNQLKARQRSHRAVLDELNDKLADKYICNFGVPEPAGHLGDRPDPADRRCRGAGAARRAGDLTCDSDGKIKHYVDEQSIESSMPVHEVAPGEEYFLGVFLVGAYQEILGDMHNPFGDTDSVNVYQREDGSYYHAGIETHDTIEDMLRYVHLSPEELMTYYRDKVAGAKLSAKERTQYIDALRLGLTRSSYLTP